LVATDGCTRFLTHLGSAALAALLFAALLLFVPAARAQDVRDDFPATNGSVTATALSGNTPYVGGQFSRIGTPGGGGIPLDQTSGGVLTGFPKVVGRVLAAVPDGAGGWYIGGSFTSVGGVPRNKVAHILADQSVGPWNPNAGSEIPMTVNALALDGDIVYVDGHFTHIGGWDRNSLAAVDAVTGMATSWDPNAFYGGFEAGSINALAVDDGIVYAGGVFTDIGGARRGNFAAIDRVTGQATDLNLHSRGTSLGPVLAVAVGSGKVYVGGAMTYRFGTEDRFGLAAIDVSNGIVQDWNPFGNAQVQHLAYSIVPIGTTIYVAGLFDAIGGQTRNCIAAVDASTGLATPWNPAPEPDLYSYALPIVGMVRTGSTLFVTGGFTSIGGEARQGLAGVDATTGLATPWNPNIDGSAQVLAVGVNAVYAGGGPFILGAVKRNNLAAIDVATGNVTDWDPSPDGSVSALAVSGATVYVGGVQYIFPGFTHIGGQARVNLAAIDATTGRATSWNPNPTGAPFYGVGIGVWSIVTNQDKVYVGGGFTGIGGQDRVGVAELDATSGLATSWNARLGTPSDPNSFVVRALLLDGPTIYVGGYFEVAGGMPRKSLAALDIKTAAATPWNPGISVNGYSGLVEALAQKANTVYVGGYFSDLGGQPRPGLGAVDTKSGLATSWNPAVSADNPANEFFVTALAVSAQTLYLGGTFDHVHGLLRNGLAAVDLKAGDVREWNPSPTGFSYSDQGCALLVRGNAVYAGGTFTWTGTSVQSNLAVIEADHGNGGHISSPAAGAQLVGGSVAEVTWDVFDDAVSMTLLSSLDDGTTWKAEAEDIPNTGHYAWHVPSVATTSARVELISAIATSEIIESDAFSIAAPLGVDAAIPALALQPSNPVTGPLVVRFSLPSPDRATLSVYDVSGRHVLSLEVGSSGAGPHVLVLGSLPAGVYVVRLSQAGRSLSARTVVIH
jgi:hypothetical protein